MKVEGGNEGGGKDNTLLTGIFFFVWFNLCVMNMKKNVHCRALIKFPHTRGRAQNPELCKNPLRNWQLKRTDTLESHRKFTQ